MIAAIRTERLVLRDWTDADLAPFAALNADPDVMEHFPAPLTRAESDATATRIRAFLDEHGWGLWAIEVPGAVAFAGFVGLTIPTFDAHFTPCVEIGWRLSKATWGQGYATEAARASLAHAFGALGLRAIVALTVPGNRRSRRVMEKLAMTRDPRDDFDHPRIPEGHPLRRHVLYRVRKV